MAKPDKISHFLPVSFANGNSVRRFGKHCPKCQAMVAAEQMEGLLSKQKDKIFLVAQAHCPSCHHRFAVACVITNDKRVHRVGLPQWLFQFWLQMLTRHDPQPASKENWEVEPVESHGASLSSSPRLVLAEDSSVVCSDEVIGRFQGEPIWAWIEYQGQRFIFERTTPENTQPNLSDSELLFGNWLIYRSA
ncbi:hypothetical protein HZU77_003590 [Neisseriaceae bacterium TC5R-5]|nr:hypothetical protein [Neisseriaceae bacterium TC5R-5]